MRRCLGLLPQWGPALTIMAIIFVLSSQAGGNLPDFGSLDYVVKKLGHVVGYGLLGLADWRGLKLDPRRIWHAWLLAVLYAATDEFHQSFVAGRHSSIVDVVAFDGTGAAIALWVGRRLCLR